MKLSVAGLFVGCGGLDFGFKQAGFDLVWANEISSDASESYKKLCGHKPIVDDIWNCLDQIPKVDVLVGGPPCQSFSLVGKRLEDDPRGQLVFAFEQAIQKVQPKFFVMENVPGLMASKIDGKRLHLHLAEKFSKMGYCVGIYKLSAHDYFVPQKRVRVFMVGHRFGSLELPLISSEKYAGILGFAGKTQEVTVSEALDDLSSPLPKGSNEELQYAKSPHSYFSKLMRMQSGDTVSLQTMPTMSKLDRAFVRHIPPGGNYMNIPDEISTKRIMKFKASGGRTTTYGRLHPDRPAYTINTYFNRPNVGANYHHGEERLITVREAMRLQSFPDKFIPVFSNQRSLHMQVGNAVPPLLGQAIAESISFFAKTK